MRELKELTCKNCGGRINPATMTCEYCGTQYEERMDRIVFVSDRQAEVLRAAVLINDEMIHLMGEETVSKYAIDEIALKLAEGLKKCMDVMVQERPELNSHEIRASVRVLPIGYKF